MNRPRPWIVIGLMVAAALSRVAPHPYNCAPMTAMALFVGATFASLGGAAAFTLVSLLLSNVFLELTFRADWQPNAGFYEGQWSIYAIAVLPLLIGRLIRNRKTVATVAGASVASSVVFFLVTNLACVYEPFSTYPHTISGIMQSYAAGMAFYRQYPLGPLGDLFYSAVLFGGFALLEARFPEILRDRPAPAAVA